MVLRTTGIESLFDCVYSAKTYSSKSEAIKVLIDRHKTPVLIGDTTSDILAAQDNNIPFIYAEYGYGTTEELKSSIFTIQSFDCVLGLISQIDLFYVIYEKAKENGWRVVGINGVDTSGKTEFTNNFEAFLISIEVKTCVIHIDDFHNPLSVRKEGNNEIDAYYYNAFNYGLVIDELLSPMRIRNIDKTLLCLDLDTDEYSHSVHYDIDEKTVELVEGVLLYRAPILKYFDGKIFLDIDFSTVIDRAKKRDVPRYGVSFLKKYYEKYIPIQKRYFNECKPKEISNIVIDNNDFTDPKIISRDSGLNILGL